MRKCEKCGGPLGKRIAPEYRHETIGLPGVVLLNAVEEIYCKKCGEVDSYGFPNLDGLIAAIAVRRAQLPTKLTGREIRFLRKALEWSAKELAEHLEVRPETVSRWENDQEPIGPTSEKLLRFIVTSLLSAKAPAVELRMDLLAALHVQALAVAKSFVELCFRSIYIKIGNRREKVWEPVERRAA